jgi:peroxiredoxin
MALKPLIWPARIILALAAFCSIALCSCSKKGEQQKQEAQENPNVTIETISRMPDIVLKRLDGSEERLSYYQGKIVILNLWATWQKDSKRQITELNSLYPTLQGTPVVLLGVLVDDNGEAALRKFLETTKVDYPLYYNGKEIAGELGGTRTLPITYVVYRDGSIYKKWFGFHPERDYRDMLDEMKRNRM